MCGTAHDDDLFDFVRDARVFLQGQGDVGQRANRHEDDFARVLIDLLDDEIGRAQMMRFEVGRVFNRDVAKAVFTMNEIREAVRRLLERYACAFGDGDVFVLEQIEQVACIGGGLIHRHIAKNGGQADEFDFGVVDCVGNGQCVVYARIGVDNHFIRHVFPLCVISKQLIPHQFGLCFELGFCLLYQLFSSLIHGQTESR